MDDKVFNELMQKEDVNVDDLLAALKGPEGAAEEAPVATEDLVMPEISANAPIPDIATQPVTVADLEANPDLMDRLLDKAEEISPGVEEIVADMLASGMPLDEALPQETPAVEAEMTPEMIAAMAAAEAAPAAEEAPVATEDLVMPEMPVTEEAPAAEAPAPAPVTEEAALDQLLANANAPLMGDVTPVAEAVPVATEDLVMPEAPAAEAPVVPEASAEMPVSEETPAAEAEMSAEEMAMMAAMENAAPVTEATAMEAEMAPDMPVMEAAAEAPAESIPERLHTDITSMVGSREKISAALGETGHDFAEIRDGNHDYVLIRTSDEQNVMCISYEDGELMSLSFGFEKDGNRGYADILTAYVTSAIRDGKPVELKRHKGAQVVSVS